MNIENPVKSHSLYALAICRSLSEGGDGYAYFGSFGGWLFYKEYAVRLGWLDTSGALTEEGLIVGKACQDIPKGRAYFHFAGYQIAVESVMGRIEWEE